MGLKSWVEAFSKRFLLTKNFFSSFSFMILKNWPLDSGSESALFSSSSVSLKESAGLKREEDFMEKLNEMGAGVA